MIRFVDAPQARRLLDEGAIVVDARTAKAARAGHLPGAATLDWTTLRDGWGRTGRLTDDDDAVAERLGELGVEPTRTVVVYGAAHRGGGEEGRVAWMLAYLGVDDVALLDGGIAAWRRAGLPIERGPLHPRRRSAFRPRRDEALRATAEQLLAAVERADAVILDVRSEAEWQGATPHLAPRGGRIPAARHFEWSRLLDDDGRLWSRPAIETALLAAGVRRDDEVLLYCAGGVRSAFVWAALRALGWPRVRMYDGSFLEWSRRRALPVEHARRPVGRRLLAWAAGALAVSAAIVAVRRAARTS